jgi:hypothetical protein
LDSSFFTLVAAPSIAKLADRRGRALAADALSAGFSFTLGDPARLGGQPSRRIDGGKRA